MKKEEIVDIIINGLQKKDVLADFCKMQNSKAVQIKLKDGTYYNICMAELRKSESFIAKKNKIMKLL
jgi:hypothetical protein